MRPCISTPRDEIRHPATPATTVSMLEPRRARFLEGSWVQWYPSIILGYWDHNGMILGYIRIMLGYGEYWNNHGRRMYESEWILVAKNCWEVPELAWWPSASYVGWHRRVVAWHGLAIPLDAQKPNQGFKAALNTTQDRFHRCLGTLMEINIVPLSMLQSKFYVNGPNQCPKYPPTHQSWRHEFACQDLAHIYHVLQQMA